MYTAILPLLALAGLTAAQSTISLWIPGADQMPLVASAIASDKAATTYLVQCVPGTDSSDCGIANGITLTEGPSTAAYTMSLGYSASGSSILALSINIACSLSGTASAICTETDLGEEANFPGATTNTYSGTDFAYQVATLTQGLSLSQIGGGSATNTATNTAATATKTGSTSSGSGSVTGTASKTGSASAATGTGSTTGSVSSKVASGTSSAGAAMITRKAEWIVGGAGAAVAWALL